ncbi:MAG: VWA domain-containing protein [Pseudomonas sp.]|nr:VWA domain-containing protein [Pseudomonas sp.]
MTDSIARRRWRLILGAEAEAALAENGAGVLDDGDRRRDAALEYLYGREFEGRERAGEDMDRYGGIGRPDPGAVRWLGEVRKLFPRSVAEVLQRDALDRYRMSSLLADPQVLAQATPSIELVQTLMAVRERLPTAVHAEALRLIRRVVEQLEERLAPRLRAAFAPRRKRHGRGGRPRLADLDWARTLRHNLPHYQFKGDQLKSGQVESGELVLERLFFHPREERRLPWHLWLVVDQSGSMSESVIHSAVMAGIFARLRAVRTRLLLFADEVVDVSSQLQAPEQLLMGAQIGGGTNIGAALAAAFAQVEVPRRSVVVLISDLCEGHDTARVLGEAARLVGSGVSVLALAALDRRGNPDYDRAMAAQLVARGVPVAAMTPDHLVDWLATTMQGR